MVAGEEAIQIRSSFVIAYVDLEVALVLILNFLTPFRYMLNNLGEASFSIVDQFWRVLWLLIGAPAGQRLVFEAAAVGGRVTLLSGAFSS
jgi:hypothetical protein